MRSDAVVAEYWHFVAASRELSVDEARTLTLERIQVRRFHVAIARVTEILRPPLIGNDDEYIRPFRLPGNRGK